MNIYKQIENNSILSSIDNVIYYFHISQMVGRSVKKWLQHCILSKFGIKY